MSNISLIVHLQNVFSGLVFHSLTAKHRNRVIAQLQLYHKHYHMNMVEKYKQYKKC